MIRDLRTGVPKLFYSEERKSFAGEQLTKKEKIALIGISYSILVTVTIAGALILLHYM